MAACLPAPKDAPNVYRGYKYPVPHVTYQFDTNVW